MIQGKKVTVIGWEHAPQLEELQKKVFEAYGFPKAQPLDAQWARYLVSARGKP